MMAVWQDPQVAAASLPATYGTSGGDYTFQYVTANGSSAAQNVSVGQQGVSGAAMLTGGGAWGIPVGWDVIPILSNKYFALYSQNDWRATSKLTINLGLRWDLQPGPVERHNRMSFYDLNQKSAFGTEGAILFPGVNGQSRHLWPTDYRDFGPRLGAAYQLTSNLVVRGGFGISYLPGNTGYYNSPLKYACNPFTSGTNPNSFGTSPNGVPVGTFSNPIVSPIIPIVGANTSAPEIYAQIYQRFTTDVRNGRAAQWNFVIERRFGNNWFASAGYSGTHSSNLQDVDAGVQTDVQRIPDSTLAAWHAQYVANNGTLDPANEQIPNPFQPASGPLRNFGAPLGNQTIPRFITLMPWPLLYGTTFDIFDGFADYNALELHLKHAFSSGLQMDAHYTWSKSLDFVSTTEEDKQSYNSGSGATAADERNYANNKKVSFDDIPGRFVASFIYEPPFGAGRSLEIHNRVLRDVVGKWQTSGVMILQRGFPFGASGASTGAALARPDRIAGVPVEVPKALQHWYDGNTTVTLPDGRRITPAKNTFLKYYEGAFKGQVITTPNGSVVPDLYWFGTAASVYNDLRGPGRFNLDMSLRRIFPLREKMNLELAVDATNVLNHTEYSGNYNGALGNTNLATNAARGLVPGMGSSDTYGTLGVAAYDNRQFVLNLRLRF